MTLSRRGLTWWAVAALAALLPGTIALVVLLTRPGPDSPASAATGPASTSPGVSPPATPVPVAVVPPLGRLSPPDVVITLPRPASASAVRALRSTPGVRVVSLAARGTIRVHRKRLRVLGVSLATIRGFTPSVTAISRPLWQSVARGELTVSYADNRRGRLRLGATYSATGRAGRAAPLRVGAFATLGLPGAQALLTDTAAAALGVPARREVLVSAPKAGISTLTAAAHRAFGDQARVAVTRIVPVDQNLSSAYAQQTIPASYLALYRRAAPACPGLPWTVLAGIGTVESGNGYDVHRSTAGALGPMQFLPSTWAMYGYDADGDGKADINDPVDAVFSAARYLCAAGAGRGGQSLDDAIYAYNHAWWYVREVVDLANRFA